MVQKPIGEKKRPIKKKVVGKKPAAKVAPKKKVPVKKKVAKKVISKKAVDAPAKYPIRMHRIVYNKYMQRPNVSNTVKNALLLGASTKQCLSMVKKWFPKSTLNASNVSQFRNALRKEGLSPVEKDTTIKEIIGK